MPVPPTENGTRWCTPGGEISLDRDLVAARAPGGRSPPGRIASSPPARPTFRTARAAARRRAGCAPLSCPPASTPPGPGWFRPTSTGRTRSFGMGCASDLGVALIRSTAERICRAVQAPVGRHDLEVLLLPFGESGQVAAVPRDRHGYGPSCLGGARHPDPVCGRMRRPVQDKTLTGPRRPPACETGGSRVTGAVAGRELGRPSASAKTPYCISRATGGWVSAQLSARPRCTANPSSAATGGRCSVRVTT